MNILDKISEILNMQDVKLGFIPDKPDSLIALFEYQATPPEHSFGKTDIIYNIQVRTRAVDATAAYTLAKQALNKLNRYQDNDISVLQSTAILDIGRDSKQRQEYTINFTVRRL